MPSFGQEKRIIDYLYGLMKGFVRLILGVCFVMAWQGIAAQTFRGGFEAGVTASEVSGDDAGGPDKLGWYALVFTNTDVHSHARLQLELMYIQKGSRAYHEPWDEEHANKLHGYFPAGSPWKEDDPIEPDPSGYRDYRFNLHYVEVPLLLQFDFSPLTRLPYVEHMSGEFGVSASVVVGHFEENEGMDVTDLMAELRPFKAAELNLLAGLYLPISDGLRFHMRFSQGITPLRTRYGKDEISCAGTFECYRKRHQFNTVWSFGLSYTFLMRQPF